MLQAARTLPQLATRPSGRIVEIALGITPPQFAQDVPAKLVPFNLALNASQLDAVRFALSASDVAIIHGPPGRSPRSGDTSTRAHTQTMATGVARTEGGMAARVHMWWVHAAHHARAPHAGTGKTTTLIEIIRQIIARDGPQTRILACGPSNISVGPFPAIRDEGPRSPTEI